jgi:hypothetical protein
LYPERDKRTPELQRSVSRVALPVVFSTVGWPGSMTLMPLTGSVVVTHPLGAGSPALTVIKAGGGISAVAGLTVL